MRLNSKIALVVIPLIALPLTSVGTLAYLELWKSSETQSRIQIKTQLQQLAERYQTHVRSAQFALKNLANDTLLKDYLLSEDQKERDTRLQRPLLNKLANTQAANPDFYEVRLLLPDGSEALRLVNRNLLNITKEEFNTPFFSHLSETQFESSEFVGINPDTGLSALFVSLPIYLRNSTYQPFTTQAPLRGILSITQDIDKIINPRLPEPWEGALVILSNSQGQPLTPLPHSNLIAMDPQALASLHLHPKDQWRKMVINGVVMHHLTIPLNKDLNLHTLLPEQPLLAASQRVGMIVLLTTGIALLVSTPLLLLLLRRQILLPIASLNCALSNLGENQNRLQLERSSDDEIGELVTTFNRMSIELYDSNEKIRHLAYLDSLTGLPNRVLFRRNLKRALAASDRDGKLLALLFLDLDNFKHVNDNMGHPVGDRLLQQVAHRLLDNLRADDQAGRIDHDDLNANFSRLGGDEFTVLLPHLDSPHQAGQVAERIIASLAQPICIDSHQFFVGTSIGIALWPDDGISAEQLISHADLAMYQAKNQGKNNFQYFSHTLGEQSRERARLEQRLRRATESNDFNLVYQPIYDCHRQQLLSFEALIRWNDVTLGNVAPDRFIPLAEENGLIFPISLWVLNESCRQIREWQDAGYDNLQVGINLSGAHLSQPEIITEIDWCLHRHRLSSKNIYVELTETAVIKGKQRLIENLNKLRKMGIKVALDDFGTGYSSLSYLQNLPIDILKIDSSFIQSIGEQNHSIILSSIITMAHALGLQVIAEGVEEEADLQFLRTEDCDMIQGYLFSHPLPPAQAIALLTRKRLADQAIAARLATERSRCSSDASPLP